MLKISLEKICNILLEAERIHISIHCYTDTEVCISLLREKLGVHQSVKPIQDKTNDRFHHGRSASNRQADTASKQRGTYYRHVASF